MEYKGIKGFLEVIQAVIVYGETRFEN